MSQKEEILAKACETFADLVKQYPDTQDLAEKLRGCAAACGFYIDPKVRLADLPPDDIRIIERAQNAFASAASLATKNASPDAIATSFEAALQEPVAEREWLGKLEGISRDPAQDI
jgi:hypothetical protein